jgi:hypothetical protein
MAFGASLPEPDHQAFCRFPFADHGEGREESSKRSKGELFFAKAEGLMRTYRKRIAKKTPFSPKPFSQKKSKTEKKKTKLPRPQKKTFTPLRGTSRIPPRPLAAG